MNEKTDYALVPRPPSALEKAEPGARRILSSMVADTLALARKEKPTKPVFRVAICGYMGPCSWLGQVVARVLRVTLASERNVGFKGFFYMSDVLDEAWRSRFDLFILVLTQRLVSWETSEVREVNPYGVITSLKREFKEPILVISDPVTYSSTTKFEQAGANASLSVPFSGGELRFALQKCLEIPLPDLAKSTEPHQPSVTFPPRIVMCDYSGRF